MFLSTSDPDITALMVLGVGAALLGLLLLFGARWSIRWRCLVLAAVTLLAAGLALAAPQVETIRRCRVPFLILAGASAVCLLLALPFPDRLLARIVKLADRPYVPGLALLGGGLFVLLAWPWYVERIAQSGQPALDGAADRPGEEDRSPIYRTLWTDEGSDIRVRDLRGQKARPDDVASEEKLTQYRELAMHLKRTAPADPSYNCHGWNFTAGRYVVDGADVDRILIENGYVEVNTPRVGDLIIYRTRDTHVSHSGVVQAAAEDGLVLVESKWTSMGRFLHLPEAYESGTPWHYYRSPRAGHLLHGLEDAPPSGERNTNQR